MRFGLRACIFIAGALTFLTVKALSQTSPSPGSRDIAAVLSAHDKELLAIPGVVGVYVGVLDDKTTPCLKVMLSRRSPEADRDLPKQLEGYPVIAEVTGEIRPLATP